MDNKTFKIDIPADNDGFVLFQCSLCSEFFKLRASECQADDVIEIHCPSCGLISDNYFTEDIISLAMAMSVNYMREKLYDSFSSARSNKLVNIKANKPQYEEEYRINSGIEALEVQEYLCCNREAKIKELYKMCGSYCPYCGVHCDGN